MVQHGSFCKKGNGQLAPLGNFGEICRFVYAIFLPFYPGSFRLCVQHGQLGLLGFAIHLIHFHAHIIFLSF